MPLASFLRLLLDALLPSPVDLALAQTPWQPCPAHAYCARCGVSAGPGEAREDGCSACVGKRLPWMRVTRLDAWDEPVKRFVHAMKYRQHFAFAPWFGDHLAHALTLDTPAHPVVVAVPMHWTRRMERGYNQAELIARALGRAQGWRCVKPLKRVRAGARQVSQSQTGRARNVRGAFALCRGGARCVRGQHVILVDDVLTTGATARACTRLLKRAGARSVQVAVVAVAQLKH